MNKKRGVTWAQVMGEDHVRADQPDDILQWLFNTDFMVEELGGRLINCRYLCQALRDLRTASWSPTAPAQEVKLAWQVLLDVAGPILLGRFIAGGGWIDFCPDAPKSRTPTITVVWKRGDESIVARVVYTAEVPADIRFDIE